MGYTRSKTPRAYTGSFKPGAFGFTITKSETTETKSGKEAISLDFQLYNLDDRSKANEIKYFNMLTDSEDAMRILDNIMYAVDLESYNNVSELVGKGGVMLVGYEQDFRDLTSWYPKPYKGGFSAFFNKDKLSPSEIVDNSTVAEEFATMLSALIEKPYRDDNGIDYERKPVAETSSDMPEIEEYE